MTVGLKRQAQLVPHQLCLFRNLVGGEGGDRTHADSLTPWSD